MENLDEIHLGSSTQMKSIKPEEIVTSKSKPNNSALSSFKKILNLITCFTDIFLSCFNKLGSCLSNCSIIVQFSLILIPISIIMIILIFYIHLNFYSDLYSFNFSKAMKEEFLDLYITKIDDLKTEVTAILVKETKFDVENQLFFQVYFKELSSVGFINNDNEKFIKDFDNEDSVTLYKRLNNLGGVDINFDVELDLADSLINKREDDQFGEFAKIYYYMFPLIWYESLLMRSIINQSFFIAYEFVEEEGSRYINDSANSFFFRYPKNSDGFTIKNNFVPNNYLLNPLVSNEEFSYPEPTDNYYEYENWFHVIDYNFRKSVNIEEDLFTNISLAHLNIENDGDINKTFISFSQQYIKHDDRYYIFNIIFFLSQIDLKEGDNDYSFFIIKDNKTGIINQEDITERYSDNLSYVASISDITEYSLSDMDFRFFHLGLYDNNYNFYMNGILYDTFNLNYFFDISSFYTSAKEGEYDLKFFVSIYLYKSLFQNIKYSIIKKDREEIYLFNFKDEEKVQKICSKINFDSYRDYLANSGVDCWQKRNRIFYDEDKYLYVTMDNDSNTIEPIYPYCSCLPLYCLKNYEDLDKDLDNLEFSNEINLPNKCQNKFINYESSSPNSEYKGRNRIKKLIDSNLDPINYDYIKFIFLELNQLPGHFFLIISQIKTSGEAYIHTYYKLITKLEIIILVLGVLIITSILSIIILYNSLKKYSLIISNFKQKYEFYVFHSYSEAEANSNNSTNLNKYMRIKEDKKVEDQLINNENLQSWETDSLISKDFFNINDNTLLDDIFLIFSETYNISRKDIEQFYSQQNHKSKNQMRLDMMKEKNELFELLSTYCLHAPFFQLNLNFDYNMYEYSEIMKKYNHYVGQLENKDREQTRLTQNILYELISTECIADYGLITNFNFKYVTNIKADVKRNSIKYTMFENIKNKQNKNDTYKEENDIDEVQVKKLVLKKRNVLIDVFKNRFESDDFLNYNKLDSAFNFFLINSYYKYSRQIALENLAC